MIDLRVRFRSQGISWPLRANDTVEVHEDETVWEIPGELLIEIVQHYYRQIELQWHMVNGTVPRKPPVPMTTPSPDLLEQRRRARRSRKRRRHAQTR